MKLEDRLADALARIADSTPINDPGAFVPDVMTLRSDLESSAPSHRVLAVAAAIVVVGVAGIVVVANRPGTNGASDAPTPPSLSIVPNTTSASSPSALGEPGPVGSMVLPQTTGMSVAFAEEGSLVGDSSMRWYATSQAQAETGRYLRLFSYQNGVPAGESLGCDVAVSVTRVGVSVPSDGLCFKQRDASDPFGRVALDRSPYSIIIEGNVTDDELLTAARNVVPSVNGAGFEISEAGLPSGVSQTGTGWNVSDFAATSVDAADNTIIQVNWVDVTGRSIFYVATTDDAAFTSNLRLGFESVTDITVRGVPAFIRTLDDQPDYRGVVWHANGITFQVGSQRLSESELLDLVEQMRPATQSEWVATVAATTTVESTLAVVGGDVVMDDVLPPGAWTGARTSAVGQSLLLFFVGAAAYEPGQSCTMRYVPVVEETETEVHVVIRGEHPPAADATTACTLVGYPRSVTVELAQPFGDRTLVALGQSRRVFDGSTLAEPRWIPDGWQPSSESPGLLDPGTATSWIRSWVPPVPPPGEGSCLLGASGLALLEGSPDVVNRSTPPAEQTFTGTHDINGSSATSSIQTNRNITRLAWTTGNRSYLLSSSPACDGDQPPSLDIMLRFARSLDTSTSR